MKIKKKGSDEDENYKINKTINIPDELKLRQDELKKAAEEEFKKDTTFEEFFETYGDHIVGKIDP
jgi:hypothetical protein